ncbi:MAG: hypothetical protein ABR915_25670, partial [Thermoguttaceae bacterium]
NTTDLFGCQSLYNRDGVKVYFDFNTAASGTPDTSAGDLGMFNINGMGYAGDLGVLTQDIRYTSFDTSLVRLLVSCFQDYFRGPAGGLNITMDTYYPNFSAMGAAGDAQRLHVAQLISSAIITARYGTNGLPGERGREKARPGHQRNYIPITRNLVATGGTVSTLTDASRNWPGNLYTSDLVALVAGTGAGQIRSISGNTSNTLTVTPNWGVIPDTTTVYQVGGVPVSGAFWGKVGAYAGGILTADTTQPGWRDWIPNDRWVHWDTAGSLNCYVYFATGQAAGSQTQITASGANTLTIPGLTVAVAPSAGDSFCILPVNASSAPPSVLGVLGVGNYAATAIRWPDGTLACDANSIPLQPMNPLQQAVYPWASGNIAWSSATQVWLDSAPDPAVLFPDGTTNYVLRVLDGTGRGQVRQITAISGNLVTLSGAAWPNNATLPVPLTLRGASIVSAGSTGTAIVDSTAVWQPNQWVGREVRLLTGVGMGQARRIFSNTTNTLNIIDSRIPPETPPNPFTPAPATDGTATYDIASQGYSIERDCFTYDLNMTAAGNALTDALATWGVNALAGYTVNIYAGAGAGQTRTIVSNSATTLWLDRGWAPLPDGTSRYRIELIQDYKFRPDDPQGDDSPYLAVILRDPVIVPALECDGIPAANAPNAADALLPSFQNYLSASIQNLAATQQLASINDWATDGIDNDGINGIDDPGEAVYETVAAHPALAQKLYTQLHLSNWAHAPDPKTPGDTVAKRVGYAAQLVANIIDFRDPGDVPTTLDVPTFDSAGSAGTVFGYKGVHFTEVMASPGQVTNIGNECYDCGDGNPANPPDGQNLGWNWNAVPPYWQMMTNPDPLTLKPEIGKWRYPSRDRDATNGIPSGWYAM